MTSIASANFWREYDRLPSEIQRAAVKQYRLWMKNPSHPSLQFKPIRSKLWAVRVTQDYRALADELPQHTFLWFWIGPHKVYDRLI